MKTIWKYSLSPYGTYNIPKGGKVLAVQVQQEQPTMWVLVDPVAPLAERKFSIYGTGHDMPDNPGEYVGTFQIQGGALVFHVFDNSEDA